MKKYSDILRKCPLFDGMKDEEIDLITERPGAVEKHCVRGETILAEGDPVRYFGIVLSGGAQIVRIDYYGNRSILTDIAPPQIFGEAFACAGLEAMPVDVVATGDTSVLLIDAAAAQPGAGDSRLLFNLLRIVSKKNLLFHRRAEITSRRTTREKLMIYLMLEAKKNGSRTFTVPYDRQELADYLEVDRSGLSAEIGKLRREGVLECRRSTFTLPDLPRMHGGGEYHL